MKKVISTLLFIFFMSAGYAQTYYWVGGTGGSWSSSSSWSATVGGSGGARVTPASADILVFDGSNIGASATGAINVQPSAETIAELRLQNSADLSLARTTSGTTYLSISNTAAVSANSKLSITGNTGVMALVLLSSATSNINGSVFITGTAQNRISIQAANSLNFLSGSTCTVNSGTSPFSTTTTGTNPTVDKSVVFQNGSTLVYQGGANLFGGSSLNIAQFSAGSTFIFEATNISGILSSGRILSNVIVRNNATVTADGNPYNINNLTINSGASFYVRGSGTFPVTGNIINDGTFGAAATLTTANLIMCGSAPQTISGTGTFAALGALSIASVSDVTLERSLTLNGTSSSSISGKLNLKTNTLTGTNAFGARSVVTTPFTGDVTTGSQTISNLSVFSGIVLGSVITGPGIPAGTLVIATSLGSAPGGSITISNAATATTTATSLVGSNTNATLQTQNTAGIDASVAVSGSRSFAAGVNYIFDAATTAPFSTSSTNGAGDVILNANVTTNRTNLPISGTLTMNTSKLTIRSTDTIRITSGNAIAGGSFGTAKYIVTDKSGNSVGVLAMDAISSARTFPIGSATNYLPVTLTPTTTDAFAVSAFEGITADATPAGTAFTAAQKAMVVDAVWTINRTSTNTDNCSINLSWPASLEGSSFAGFGNSIGVAGYTTAWGTVGGSGNNTTNTATNSFNTFGGFGVGKLTLNLPVKFSSITANELQGKIKIDWKVATEINTKNYVIEQSTNGVSFTEIGNVVANNASQYSSIDNNPSTTNYYRIKAIDKSGSFDYSSIVQVKLKNSKAEIAAYPNPIIGNQLNVQLANLTVGNVELKLINQLGQQIFSTNVNYAGGNQIQNIQLPSTISKGLYKLVVTTSNNNQLQQSILVN